MKSLLTELESMPFIGGSEKIRAELTSELARTRNEDANPLATKAFSGENLRNETRYQLSLPATLYPVLPSGEVDVVSQLPAIIADISKSGMNLWLKSDARLNNGHVLVGVENRDGSQGFQCVKILQVNENESHLQVVNSCFDGVMNEILQNELLVPELNRDSMKFRMPISEDVIASLRAVGALEPLELDSVLLCPQCQGIPTVRSGCSWCLSSSVKASKMIHHYGCAHVDFVNAFEFEEEMCCPKCRTRKMVVGSDFEYLDGPNVCDDCGQSNLDKASIGHCLNCHNRFDMETAFEQKILGYRVNRLDTLAYINSP